MSQAVLTIVSREDAVELVLTRESVVMKLADKVLQEFDQEIAADKDVQSHGWVGGLLRFVTGAARGLMSATIEYPLEDIESVTVVDGKLKFTYLKSRLLTFDDVKIGIDGQTIPALAAFSASDSEAFARKFQEVKTGAGEQGPEGDGAGWRVVL